MALKSVQMILDDATVTAEPGQNLLAACLSARRDLPYFCWHPAMGSVGACRQCAVKLFKGPEDMTGQIVMACMTPVIAGMRVSISDAETARFREAVVEEVLTNHPHDCPVCDVGGECHLQDMTALTGHHTRRYRFTKRTHLNQELGPFIRHEMNRCIGCYRCVRFYRDHAGGDDFGVFGANRNIYFGRAEQGTLASPFAGNLVEVCPTGVFTDKPFSTRFRRKWDMRATPSVCAHCAVGCNITINEREGEFRRVVNRFNPEINGYFLCDRGRFGMDFVATEKRLRQSRQRTGRGIYEPLSTGEAPTTLASVLRQPGVIGIGSPRASVEANYALRQVVGPENFFTGVSDHDSAVLAETVAIMSRTDVPIASLGEVECADAVLILGDDPTGCAPRLALALRQALQRPTASHLVERHIPAWQDEAVRALAHEFPIPLGIATSVPTVFDKRATWLYRDDPNAVSEIAGAIAAQLGENPPDDIAMSPAAACAGMLLTARTPLIVIGGNSANPSLLACAANIVTALRAKGRDARLAITLLEANSLGLALMEPRPLAEALRKLAEARAGHVIILENDLFRRAADRAVTTALSAAMTICALDHIETPTAAAAHLVIHVASLGESDGIFVNAEGRAQPFFKAIFGAADPVPSWTILRDAAIAAGRLPIASWPDQRALLAAIGETIPVLAGCSQAVPGDTGGPGASTLPHRYSGRTAVTAHRDVREIAPPRHVASPFATTMEGSNGEATPLNWAPGWNSGQAVLKHQAGVDRAVQDGITGVELFTDGRAQPRFLPVSPPAPRAPGLWLLPRSRVFGTEELSNLAPAIIARMGQPVVALHPQDAAGLGVEEGTLVECCADEASLRRRVTLDDRLPIGIVALDIGFPGDCFAALPGFGTIRAIKEGLV
jgi:NADH-quinone oxidoreductase subunit G